MMDLAQHSELQKKAMATLNKIRQNAVTENVNKPHKLAYTYVFEEYTPETFKDKMKYDMYIYDSLIADVENDNVVEEIQESITELYRYINKIYEHINIKPAIYGDKKLMLESEEQFEKNAQRVVSSFINSTYYDLTQEERDARYKQSVIHEAKDYIVQNQIDPNSAVKKAQKRIIYENLLKRVAFPLIVESNIEDLLESEEYEMLFDKKTLVDLYEQFHISVKKIATLITEQKQ